MGTVWAAFPANERRDAEWQARALAQDAYHMCAAAEDGALCAISITGCTAGNCFWSIWPWLRELRGRGIGAALLREIRELPGKLILEIEKPDDAKTQRRLRFYEREGLTLAPFGYDAPGYQAGTGDCALQLMSEGAMSKLEFARHRALLQEVVLDCTAGGAKPLCIWKE